MGDMDAVALLPLGLFQNDAGNAVAQGAEQVLINAVEYALRVSGCHVQQIFRGLGHTIGHGHKVRLGNVSQNSPFRGLKLGHNVKGASAVHGDDAEGIPFGEEKNADLPPVFRRDVDTKPPFQHQKQPVFALAFNGHQFVFADAFHL